MHLPWKGKAALERLYEEDTFVVKAGEVYALGEDHLAKGRTAEDVRPIGGFCSTDRLDRQGEVVVQKGLDFSEFVKWGFFNDNHKQDTACVLGYPTKAVLKGGRWWTEGRLFKDYEPADRIWALAKALKGSSAPRRLGFSIEGKVVERDGRNRILRAKVRHVAITNSPVNPDCSWDILSKAFAEPAEVERASRKALTAGYQSPRQSGGAALRRESLEGDVRTITRKSIYSIDEAVQQLQRLRPQYSEEVCRRIVMIAAKRA
jgi:hypothetical protein